MNKKMLNEVLREYRFDYKTDITFKLLADVVDPGYFINRSIQLLREASFLDDHERVKEAIKLLIIWECNRKSQKHNTKMITLVEDIDNRVREERNL